MGNNESSKVRYWGGYPSGVWVCSMTEIFERLAYYLGRSLMLIFITASVASGGLGLSETTGANMQSYLSAFSYLLPFLGAIVVDRFIGARYMTPVGMLIAGVGYYVGSITTSAAGMYGMIFLVSFGLAFFKNGPIIGRVVTKPSQFDGAYSIRYAFTNVGAFIGPFIAGILYKDVFAHDGILGFAPCFKLAAIMMVLGAIWYPAVCWRHIGEVGRKPFKALKTPEEIEMEAKEKARNAEERKAALSPIEKKRLVLILLGAICSIFFWIFWNLAYLPVYFYWNTNANWVVLGYEVPLTWFDAANALFCVILSPVMVKLWQKLATRPKGDWSIFRKAGVSIAIIGISYFFLFLLDVFRGENKISVLWLIVFAFLLTAGEMTFSPISNAFVSRFSPTRYLSLLASLWSISTFIASISYSRVYSLLFTHGLSFSTGCIIVVVLAFVVGLLGLAMDKKFAALLKTANNN